MVQLSTMVLCRTHSSYFLLHCACLLQVQVDNVPLSYSAWLICLAGWLAATKVTLLGSFHLCCLPDPWSEIEWVFLYKCYYSLCWTVILRWEFNSECCSLNVQWMTTGTNTAIVINEYSLRMWLKNDLSLFNLVRYHWFDVDIDIVILCERVWQAEFDINYKWVHKYSWFIIKCYSCLIIILFMNYLTIIVH